MTVHKGLLGLLELQRSYVGAPRDQVVNRSLSALLFLRQRAIAGGQVPPSVPPPFIVPTDPINPPPLVGGIGELSVSAQISTSSGWLSLQDEDHGYELHAESFSSRSVSQRKVEISSGFQEGTFVVRSVRNEVVEQLTVWVKASDAYWLRQRLDALTDALSALTYQVQVTTGTLRETWTCSPADFTIESSQPLMFATMAMVRASVPRLPATSTERVTP